MEDIIKFLREKKLLNEESSLFKIIHDEAGEVILNDLLKEYSESKKEDYLRIAAEFDNYKKRVIKEKEEIINNTKVKMLTSILDMDNDLSIALKNIEDSGVRLIANKLTNFLNSQGVEEIQTDTYDEDLHEVISIIPGDNNKIVDVVTKGYSINGKPFRYPKIVISKSE
jgi:molecular chaperone GrpE